MARVFCGQLIAGLVAGLFVMHSLPAGEIARPAVTASKAATATNPILSATPVPTTDAPRQSASAGTLFIVVPASVRTPSGIIGFEPGQVVRLIRTDAKTGRLLITDGHYQVEVTPGQVTTNASVAAALRQQEEANQRAVQAAQEASLLAQKQHEAALERIELNRDVEMAAHYVRPPPLKRATLYDQPYNRRGNPYHAEHNIIPPVQGPHSIPGSLAVKSNGLGYY